jgi:CRISPR-associated endonuclease/helicase Cas3
MPAPPLAHSKNALGLTHGLGDHSEAVAKLAGGFAAAFDSAGLARCAGLWHDLGKNAEDFQKRLAAADDAHIEGAPGRVDHSTAGALHAQDKLGSRLGQSLAFVIAGHHAGLADRSELFDGRLKKPESSARLRAARANTAAYIPEAPKPEGPSFLRGLKEKTPVKLAFEFWVRMLFSCLVDADFLDTERHFDARKPTLRGGYPTPTELLARFNAYMRGLQGDGAVNEVRRRVLADCRRAGRLRERGVFMLTAPTGCGKTLAGMGFALEHAVARGMDRVIVVIPYTSIIDQNAEVYREVFGKENVIDHHASLDPKTETGRNRIACENWDAPVIVTTSVQFVESLFANRTSRCRKLHNVVNSVVIFDEVQTLPVGHLVPILDVLKQLAANYQVSLVLSTATQPAVKYRDSLRCGFQNVTEIVSDVRQTFEALRRVNVHWPADLTTPVEWPDLAAQLQAHDEVLCVVHRRDDARELADLAPQSIHLSALMCPEHRLKVIDDVKARLAANRERRAHGQAVEPVRLISTQLIEAGVDLDFPVVYRAAGGLDSIAQAAGRCNREGRLSGLGEVHVFVAPTEPPPGTPRLGLAVTRKMIAAVPALDPLDPHRFDRFFQELYFRQASLDEKKIQGLREDWCFKSVAEAFDMIDDDGTEPVVVPYGDALARLNELRDYGPTRDRLRALQPFLVTLYKQQLAGLENAGAIELVADTVRAIRAPGYSHLYSERFGLLLGGPIQADPTSLIMGGET